MENQVFNNNLCVYVNDVLIEDTNRISLVDQKMNWKCIVGLGVRCPVVLGSWQCHCHEVTIDPSVQ